LEKTGFVSRYPNPKDGRASLIRITEKGRDLMERTFGGHVENIGEIFAVLDAQEKQELILLLKKLGTGT
jgi:MarR family 2-MHQ and catechol resistance regulon transcriptional repressor